MPKIKERTIRKPEKEEMEYLKDLGEGNKRKEKMRAGEYDPVTNRYTLTEKELKTIVDGVDYCIAEIEKLKKL